MDSDIIFIFEKWKIIDSWNHKKLLEKSLYYKKLIDLQKWEYKCNDFWIKIKLDVTNK